MIAELIAVNAAYGVIKEVVGNGRELWDCAEHLVTFFDNKTQLQRKVNSKPPDQRNDLEEFLALEQIKQHEQELKELMIIAGRPGLWDDWLKFQAQQAKARREKEEAEKRAAYERKQKILRTFEWSIAGTIIICIIVGSAYLVKFLITYHG